MPIYASAADLAAAIFCSYSFAITTILVPPFCSTTMPLFATTATLPDSAVQAATISYYARCVVQINCDVHLYRRWIGRYF